ncbi:MAG: amidohydrolase family protein [Planctomycetia bacterium]|nr:amidohydrolase family protein [Planctomycetia bacterium]
MTVTRRSFMKSGIGLAVGCLANQSDAPAQNKDRLAIVDCHTHFYDPTRPEGIPWPAKDDDVLYRTVLPKHFLEQAAPLGVTKTVVIEASPRVEDNAWLLELAAANRSVVGVVGHLEPGQSDFAKNLARFAANPVFRGIRIGHDGLRAGLDKPEYIADLKRLAERDLALDVNGGPATPADVARLAEKLPELRIVINHLANLQLDGAAPPKEWSEGMQAAARRPRVFCKVSALVELVKRKPGDKGRVPLDVAFYRPVLDAMWNIFGDDRLIYGSDWPVSDHVATYKEAFAISDQYMKGRGAAAAEKFFSKNSQVAYKYP